MAEIDTWLGFTGAMSNGGMIWAKQHRQKLLLGPVLKLGLSFWAFAWAGRGEPSIIRVYDHIIG